MKTAQRHPVLIKPDVLARIESVLQEGESRSQFVEKAALDAVNQRKAQQAFVGRGRASLANARKTGELYAADDVLKAMRDRLNLRTATLNVDDGCEATVGKAKGKT